MEILVQLTIVLIALINVFFAHEYYNLKKYKSFAFSIFVVIYAIASLLILNHIIPAPWI
ncbi:hypothetical protein Phi12:1_gp19 [Cellulophaga phage phi12:1]|uniref:Uncharacterized protein n=2 Tax=Cellulophaga phage phi12:1 TaxID=1327976 RepID=R9ZZM0_9CAUD|nr:hypothetical protein Phi12:1_gp19 [Cellulophaga phage phi12:1]AGO47985.1 hypothetical protein Phi12:1_gp19 [Cellulophaga phage phi12:1]AGO48150.1 hypothetical protein Phi12:3_gp19 [Cellulophaga phage phi12:3]